MRKYKLGLVVGRFQILHAGHLEIIEAALASCEQVLLFIGSSQESFTKKNPLSFLERAVNLRLVFGTDRLTILPLPDIGAGNTKEWGDYILDQVPPEMGKPEVCFSGEETRRQSWFGEKLELISIPKTKDISSTKMRKYILDDDVKSWQQWTDPRLWFLFPILRDRIYQTQNNKSTSSV